MNFPNKCMNHMASSSINVLIAEDDDDDYRLAVKLLVEELSSCHLIRVEDGIDAMDYLYRRGAFADAQRPDLILMDLNMPRMDGRQVLHAIKSDEALSTIPVIVLTTSEDVSDIHQSYEDRANGYVTKPVSLSQYRDVLRALSKHWLDGVKLPSRVSSVN